MSSSDNKWCLVSSPAHTFLSSDSRYIGICVVQDFSSMEVTTAIHRSAAPRCLRGEGGGDGRGTSITTGSGETFRNVPVATHVVEPCVVSPAYKEPRSVFTVATVDERLEMSEGRLYACEQGKECLTTKPRARVSSMTRECECRDGFA
jgi:hypothetical protein